MSSENTVTGRGGTFSVDATAIARITQWAANPTLATSNEWGDSDSAGYTNRSAGRKDCTFTAEGKYDDTEKVFTLFVPGDIAAAILAVTSTIIGYTFARALCNDFNISVNVDTEEVIGWTSAWGADGSFAANA